MGQVAVIGLGDQPGHHLISSRSDRERFTDPLVEAGVVQRPGRGVDQVTQVTTHARKRPAEGIVDAHGRWRSLRRTHGTNLEPATDTFRSADHPRTRYPQGISGVSTCAVHAT